MDVISDIGMSYNYAGQFNEVWARVEGKGKIYLGKVGRGISLRKGHLSRHLNNEKNLAL